MRISVLIRRNGDHFQLVNLVELRRFGFRRAGHAGKLLVHAEIILEGDRGERLIFALDLHAFFRFDRLVQAVGPAASGHLAPGEFVDDHHFAFFHHVIHVALEQRVRAQPLIDVVNHVHVRRVVQDCPGPAGARISIRLLRSASRCACFSSSV